MCYFAPSSFIYQQGISTACFELSRRLNVDVCFVKMPVAFINEWCRVVGAGNGLLCVPTDGKHK